MKYYVAYNHCPELLKDNDPSTWIQVLRDGPDDLGGTILGVYGYIRMVDVEFQYFPPSPESLKCKNKINRGYAVGHISETDADNGSLHLKPSSILDTNLYKLKWKWNESEQQNMFSVAEDNETFRPVKKVDQLITIKGHSWVWI
jgi:hypothetical protein